MCVRAQVNGVDITGVGQEELVCMLRSTRLGESVCLVVLRQEDVFVPREMVRPDPERLRLYVVGCERSIVSRLQQSTSPINRPTWGVHGSAACRKSSSCSSSVVDPQNPPAGFTSFS